jgi:threonine synthase
MSEKRFKAGFKEAIFEGIAPDKSLYFPDKIPQITPGLCNILPYLNLREIAFEVLKPFVESEIPERDFKKIIEKSFVFETPVVSIDHNIYSLELYHGPTEAFKDIGARFLSSCLSYFIAKDKDTKQKHILVATSGDTGGAVAHAFLDKPGIKVHVLYPKKGVSAYQERQLTSLGKNIYAYQVDGDFDACQAMVKSAFVDQDLNHLDLSSANSINIGRWLPQMIYYFDAFKQLGCPKDISFSVPSGNFGNLAAGELARQMGLPIRILQAVTNENDTVPRYFKQGVFSPKPTVKTASNAMDVSNPSNFNRWKSLNPDFKGTRAIALDDKAGMNAILEMRDSFDYWSEPHGALGFIGAKSLSMEYENQKCVFLSTASPRKFADRVPGYLDVFPELNNLKWDKKNFKTLENYGDFKSKLLS